MTTQCESCGMPMRTVDEHAMQDPARDYCVYCARADGSRKSYEEVLDGFTAFLQKTQGLDSEIARNTAANMLASRPAWKAR
jgi:hypothetical protein